MTHLGINQKFEKVISRLKYPYSLCFSDFNFDKNKYDLLVVNKEDIFFTSPALFLWLDTGIQQIHSASTTGADIKRIKAEILQIPKCDFNDITEKYSDVCCLIDVNFNPNLSSATDLELHLNNLKILKTLAERYFTGLRWQTNTFLL